MMLFDLLRRRFLNIDPFLYARNRERAKRIPTNTYGSIDELMQQCDVAKTHQLGFVSSDQMVELDDQFSSGYYAEVKVYC